MPSYCGECVQTHRQAGGDVPCQEEGICFVTHSPPDDPEELMVPDQWVRAIAHFWESIVLISRWERIERQREKKVSIVFSPTLEKLEVFLDHQRWEMMPFDRKECFYLISVFHQTYVAELLSNI